MSILKVNTIQGIDGRGISAEVASEGGAKTTSLVQGLAKHWVNYDAVSQVTHGSFNQSSLTDSATGTFVSAYTNNISSSENKCMNFGNWNTSDNGSGLGAGLERGAIMGDQNNTSNTTASIGWLVHYGSTSASNGGLFDYEGNYCSTLGDLA